MVILLSSIALIIGIVGLIGCFLPILPGPPLSLVAMIVISAAASWTLFSWKIWLAASLAVILVTIIDFVLPPLAARQAGAGKGGIWGSVIGMLLGLLFFPPFGLIAGAFLGALLGEILINPENQNPLYAAVAVFAGTLISSLIKLAISGVLFVLTIYGMIQLL
jgi:uncharacterized protein YqgC (DUF456 family)